mmetsp:Transcript_4701/g.7322  ORF Transcript_4701/g.7322 Transcript_4701/m.7322 type:complete len:212 (+) Transcript_4701:1611-2246(+)
MTKRQLNHFTDLCHLFAASTDIVVTDIVHLLFILALDGVSLAMNDGIGRNNAVGTGICFDDFELHRMHGGSDQEQVALLDGTVRLQEVWLQVDIKEISGHSLNGVVKRQDVNALAIGDVSAGSDRDDIAQTDTQVLTNNLVHANVGIVAGFVGQDDADRIASLLSLDQDRVTSEEFQLFHFGGTEGNDRVVVVGGIVHNQTVRTAFLASGT